jgi:hypothetical protein
VFLLLLGSMLNFSSELVCFPFIECYVSFVPPCKQMASRILRYVPPKRRLQFNRLHGVTSQKMILFITTAVKTSNLASSIHVYLLLFCMDFSFFPCVLHVPPILSSIWPCVVKNTYSGHFYLVTVYLMTLSVTQTKASSDWMILNSELERVEKEPVVVQWKILCRHCAWEKGEGDIQCPCQDSNRVPPQVRCFNPWLHWVKQSAIDSYVRLK